MTGPRSAPLLPPAAGPLLPAPLVVSSSSAGPTPSSAVSTMLDSSPGPSGLRTPCSRALDAGSAGRAGPSMAGTPSAPPSNTPCPFVCAFYSSPASSDVSAPGPFLCSCGSTIDADESPFHCLDCSSSQLFNIHRHHAAKDTTIDLLNAVSSTHTSILSVLPKEPLVLPPANHTSVTDLCDEVRGHNTSLQIGPRQSVFDFCLRPELWIDPGRLRFHHLHQPSIHRYDSQQSRRAYLLPPTCSRLHGNPILLTAGVSWVQQIRTASKQARYRAVLGDLAADPDHLAIFLVEATGCLADPAMKLFRSSSKTRQAGPLSTTSAPR